MNRSAIGIGGLVPPLTLLASILITSCGDETGESAWSLAADTVDGVVRVANSPPERGPGPTLVADEELRVGTVEGGGPASFGMIRSVAVLPDGAFAVADGQAEEVRVFGRDGRHLRTFGGKGAGPGELEGMQGVHVDHEGMLRVAEQGNARLSVFHPETGFVTSYPLRLYSFGFRGPWRAAVDSAGRTLVISSGQYGEGRFWNMLRVYDPAMRQLDSIPYHDYTDESDRRRCTGSRSTIAAGSGHASRTRPSTPRSTTSSIATAVTRRPSGCRSASTPSSRPSCAARRSGPWRPTSWTCST